MISAHYRQGLTKIVVQSTYSPRMTCRKILQRYRARGIRDKCRLVTDFAMLRMEPSGRSRQRADVGSKDSLRGRNERRHAEWTHGGVCHRRVIAGRRG